jgi:peptidoglycan-N-acetylglucosamine deacetylase
MQLINKIHIKLYYLIADIILNKKDLFLPDELRSKRNLFIYFDYEREFSGHKTTVTDENITELLTFLDRHDIKSTWFAVGKIFERYPNSIIEIVNHGHEIGSHTYAHTIPFGTDKRILKADFDNYFKLSNSLVDLKGFHSPTGKWSLPLIDLLIHYNFCFDIIGAKQKKILSPYLVFKNSRKLIRLITVGDDWALYQFAPSVEEVFQHFFALYNRIKVGNLAGIGFHPWILFSNENILAGFKMFIDTIAKDINTNIHCAGWFANYLNLK